MPTYVYVHGFNSGPESRSGQALQEIIGAPVFCPRNDYSRTFSECLDDLADQIRKNTSVTDGPLCLMGTSLGGFYALQLRLPGTGQVIAWNPVIYPALQLAGFVGENTRFTDNQKWRFSHEACLSYAEAPDPRDWDNVFRHRLEEKDPVGWSNQHGAPRRDVVLGIHDVLLDHELSREYWKNHLSLLEIDAGHHIEHFYHVLTLLE